MSDLKAQFDKAQEDVKRLAERPDNPTLLKLYSYFKQATEGDVKGERPGMMDFVNRAKYDAWDKIKGTAPNEAMQAYVDVVSELMAS